MAILKAGDKCHFTVEMKVLKAFAYEDDIYYLVGVIKKNTPLKHMTDPLWGVLNVDGSVEAIPEPVMQRAATLIQSIDITNLE